MAGGDIRRVGIPGTGQVRWGEHLCTFFTSPRELLSMQGSYFRAGLEDGEYCLWVTGGAVDESAAFRRLTELVPEVQSCIARGQLEIVPYREWYFSNGRFDAQKAFDNWSQRAHIMRSCGFVGVRISGSPVWLTNQVEWDEFLAYEQLVQNATQEQYAITLCPYAMAGADEANIEGVFQSHHGVLIGNGHEWTHMHLRDFGGPVPISA